MKGGVGRWAMGARRLLLGVAAGVALAGATGAADAQAPARLQYGVRVAPDTVTVGDTIRVVVRVRAPVGAEIHFPADPDTTAALQPLRPRRIATAPDTSALDQSATYTLAAWDVDSQRVALGDVVVRLDDSERRVALGEAVVFVRSVLPADSTQRVPKPVRALVTPGVWPWWWLAVAAAVLALLAGWIWWRRRRRVGAAAAPPEDAYARAAREFARVDELRLPDAGEPGRHVALSVEVLRDYLAARIADANRAHTSAELVRALRGTTLAPRDGLARLLAEADLVKFARSPVSREHAWELGRDARRLVDETEQRWTAEQARLAAAAAAAGEAARKASVRRNAA